MDVPGCFARRVAPGDLGQAAETNVKVLQRGHWPKESNMGTKCVAGCSGEDAEMK